MVPVSINSSARIRGKLQPVAGTCARRINQKEPKVTSQTFPKFFDPMSEDQVRAVPQFNDLCESLSLDCPACSDDSQLTPLASEVTGGELRATFRCYCGAQNTLRIYPHKGTVQLNWLRPVQLTQRRAA